MVLKIDEFFTRSKSWANALQDENNRGWANNLQRIDFVFFKRHKLVNKRILCKKQQINKYDAKNTVMFCF